MFHVSVKLIRIERIDEMAVHPGCQELFFIAREWHRMPSQAFHNWQFEIHQHNILPVFFGSIECLLPGLDVQSAGLIPLLSASSFPQEIGSQNTPIRNRTSWQPVV
jgi:hypothetical protein